jgi:hypothetical protein
MISKENFLHQIHYVTLVVLAPIQVAKHDETYCLVQICKVSQIVT